MKFSSTSIREIQTALINDAAGNKQCTMTDLDMAVKMLERLIELETDSCEFKPIRVQITEGAWKGQFGHIVGEKNEVDSWPIKTDSGFKLNWFESEFIRVENP